MNAGFDVPIALIIFNRPEETSRVFSAISKIKPKRLFVIADGPRKGKNDELLIAETKKIASNTSWLCDVVTDYSDVNLGCNKRISSGLNRVFTQTNKAIILEDDCVPDLSFFEFCRELLYRYQDDQRIMNISGNNFVPELAIDTDYYFTRYAHCWGWATWARAWKNFDEKMSVWPKIKKDNLLQSILEDKRGAQYWSSLFDRTANGEVDSWAYRWTLSCWARNGLSINPRVNLVSNIGFGEMATHTKKRHKDLASLPTRSLMPPFKHPENIVRNLKADSLTERKIYSGGSFQDRAFKRLKRFFKEV